MRHRRYYCQHFRLLCLKCLCSCREWLYHQFSNADLDNLLFNYVVLERLSLFIVLVLFLFLALALALFLTLDLIIPLDPFIELSLSP